MSIKRATGILFVVSILFAIFVYYVTQNKNEACLFVLAGIYQVICILIGIIIKEIRK